MKRVPQNDKHFGHRNTLLRTEETASESPKWFAVTRTIIESRAIKTIAYATDNVMGVSLTKFREQLWKAETAIAFTELPAEILTLVGAVPE